MTSNITVVPLRQPDEVDDSLTAILRSGARQLLAQAEAEAQLRQSYWEISRKPLISRGETSEIPVFPKNVVPFVAVFLA